MTGSRSTTVWSSPQKENQMNENERKVVVRRMLLLIAVACIIMGLYTFRLIFLQLVNGDSFKAKATNTTDYKFTVTAARGNIVDSTG